MGQAAGWNTDVTTQTNIHDFEAPSIAGSGHGSEHLARAHNRQPWTLRLQVSWLSSIGRPSRPVEVRGVDISRGGLALLSRSFIHVGTRGVLLTHAAGDKPRLLCLEVCHCRYAGLWRHVVGARWAPMPQGLPIEIGRSEHGPLLIVKDWNV